MTATKVEELLADLDKVREQGYAVSRGQIEVGTTSVAVPLRDGEGEIVAAVNVAGVDASLEDSAIESRILPALHEAARVSVDLKLFWYGRSRSA